MSGPIPRLEGPRREAMLREGVQSHLTIPLLAGGRIRFVIVASCARPRTWSPAEVALGAGGGGPHLGHAGARARRAPRFWPRSRTNAFLVGLGDRLRALSDPQEVLLAAAETLGRHLGVNRAGYAELEPDGTLVHRARLDGRHGEARHEPAAHRRLRARRGREP
jgi:GAF domain-containing protein